MMRIAVLTCLAASAACATSSDDDDGRYAAAMTAADANRVVDLVNYPGINTADLDLDLGLDVRAARAIIAHRNGADGRYPSSDDAEFADVFELDAIPYVGPAALARLSAHAAAHPAPTAERIEGVAFRGWEAETVVWGVNVAPAGVLNGMLDNRAAQNLIAARPHLDLSAIAAVALVGPSALTRLRNEARTWWFARASAPTSLAGTFDGIDFDEPTAARALELANQDSREALISGGVYGAGASAIVGARPYATLAAVAQVAGVGPATMQALHVYATAQLQRGTTPENDECGMTNDCAAGLICSGTTVYGHGFCRPTSMAGTFTNATSQAIPDGAPAGITSTLDIVGLASVAEDIIVHLDVDHPRPADLRITLTQPSSADAVIWAVGSAGEARIVNRSLERDSDVNGVWTLHVIDTVTGQAGTLRSWSLELTSRYD